MTRAERQALGALLLLALAARVLEAWRATIIEHDGAMYASLAAALLRGDWRHGFSTFWPPLEPASIAALAAAVRPLGAQAGPELLERCARAISVVCGTLLLLPLHALARPRLGGRGALVAVTLAAFHPRLVQYSGSALTEMPFTLALLSSVAAFVASARTESSSARVRLEAAAGALAGVAYLARPEGALLALVTWGAGAAFPASAGRVRRLRPVFLATLALVCAPYVTYLRSETGSWTLGEKGSYNFWREHRDASRGGDLGPAGVSERAFESPELAARIPRAPIDAGGLVARRPLEVVGRTLRNLAIVIASSMPIALTPLLFVLALAGLVLSRARPHPPVIVLLAAFPLIYAPFTVDRRFFVPAIPLAILPAAGALEALAERFGRDETSRRRWLVGATLALALAGLLYGWIRPPGIDRAPEHRAAGEWLAREWPRISRGERRPPIVMSRKPWVAYYGRGWSAELPDADLGAVLARARAKRADVIVIDERWVRPTRPRLQPLLDPANAPPELVVLYRADRPSRMILYGLRERASRAPRPRSIRGPGWCRACCGRRRRSPACPARTRRIRWWKPGPGTP